MTLYLSRELSGIQSLGIDPASESITSRTTKHARNLSPLFGCFKRLQTGLVGRKIMGYANPNSCALREESFPGIPRSLKRIILVLELREKLVELLVVRAVHIVSKLEGRKHL